MSKIPRDAFERLTEYVVDGWNAYYTDGEISDGEDIRADVRAVLTELRQLRGMPMGEDDPEQFLIGRPITPELRLRLYAVDTTRWDYIRGRMTGAPSIADDVREVLDALKKLRERVSQVVSHSLSLTADLRTWLDRLALENAQVYEYYRKDIDAIVGLADQIAYKLHPDFTL